MATARKRGVSRNSMSKTILLDIVAGLVLFSFLVGFHTLTKMLFIPAMEFYKDRLRILRDFILGAKYSRPLGFLLWFHSILSAMCVMGRSLFDEDLELTSALLISIVPGVISFVFYSLLYVSLVGAAPSIYMNGEWHKVSRGTPTLHDYLSGLADLFLFHFANSLILIVGGCIGWLLSKII
jgi:hypothetical protein